MGWHCPGPTPEPCGKPPAGHTAWSSSSAFRWGSTPLWAKAGQGLSGGQRQRIALARVFLRRAKLVLLDEPTANLDLVSERYIQQAVEEMAGECTLITIAHRLHTVRNADRILVLEKGRLVQQGSHAELATQAGLYAELVGSCQRKSA